MDSESSRKRGKGYDKILDSDTLDLISPPGKGIKEYDHKHFDDTHDKPSKSQPKSASKSKAKKYTTIATKGDPTAYAAPTTPLGGGGTANSSFEYPGIAETAPATPSSKTAAFAFKNAFIKAPINPFKKSSKKSASKKKSKKTKADPFESAATPRNVVQEEPQPAVPEILVPLLCGGQRAFERSLASLPRSHDGFCLPLVFREAIDNLEGNLDNPESRSEIVQLYQGHETRATIDRLRHSYESGELVLLSQHGLIDVAGLLQAYLRSLPEPLLTTDLLKKFEDAGERGDLQLIGSLLGSVPQANYVCLAWFCHHLHHLTTTANTHNSTFSSAALCRSLQTTVRFSHRLLLLFVTHAPRLFGDCAIKRFVPLWMTNLPETTAALKEWIDAREASLTKGGPSNAGGSHGDDDWQPLREISYLRRCLRKLNPLLNASKFKSQQSTSASSKTASANAESTGGDTATQAAGSDVVGGAKEAGDAVGSQGDHTGVSKETDEAELKKHLREMFSILRQKNSSSSTSRDVTIAPSSVAKEIPAAPPPVAKETTAALKKVPETNEGTSSVATSGADITEESLAAQEKLCEKMEAEVQKETALIEGLIAKLLATNAVSGSHGDEGLSQLMAVASALNVTSLSPDRAAALRHANNTLQTDIDRLTQETIRVQDDIIALEIAINAARMKNRKNVLSDTGAFKQVDTAA